MTLTGIMDIGSNSMRLSILKRFDNGGFYVVDEHKSTPRLSNAIQADGTLSERGIVELMTHLSEFQGLCKAYNVSRLVAIGTAALRAAKNRDDIVRLVRQEIGLDIQVISGEEEALLGYSAITHTLRVDTAYVIDIGGGSTEISLLEGGKLIATHSFPFGAVTLSHNWPTVSTRESIQSAISPIVAALRAKPYLTAHPGIEIIGIGGTLRNLASVHQARIGYPLSITHNYTMSAEELRETVIWLGALPVNQRKKVEGLSRDRVDLIVPGATILLALIELLHSQQVRVSGRGLRDGVFYSHILGEPTLEPARVLRDSVLNTLRRFQESEVHATHVTDLAFYLYRDMIKWGFLSAGADRILFTAAMLHRIGVQVSYYHYDRHTFYLILNSALYGLTHREIILAAAAASFKGKSKLRKICAPYRLLLTEEDLQLATKLGVLVRLAEALDRRHERRIHRVSVKSDDHQLVLMTYSTQGIEVEQAAAQSCAPYVKKNFKRTLRIESEEK
ncbi:Ppx/GppA phosphatase family protein [Sulfoacidibacillus thermotolerans]|uniref:Chaperone protein DnaK n=1 Tax=Sulfoacidibacillus thermotolerans TaxID=1765684 RepID=A0A2U3DAM3_SULT2|nr:Ppx/GppA phosphatase family protein [Sulfoacidibacillus thermotolerans]PWI58339.1 hypothetical protein BM613_03730 [Sulfoacidibacillus thermotolerans]